MARNNEVKEQTSKGYDKVSVTLTALYALFLIAAVAILAKIVIIQRTFYIDESEIDRFRPKDILVIEQPVRGAIYDCKGRPLALSTKKYQVRMDCQVLKKDYESRVPNAIKSQHEKLQKKYANKRRKTRSEKERADSAKAVREAIAKSQDLENLWRRRVDSLSWGLEEIYGDKTAKEYYDAIIARRDGNMPGRRDWKIGGLIGKSDLDRVKALPPFNLGPNYGGIKIDTIEVRQYPYGALARRTIGYVKGAQPGREELLIGIEGSKDAELHGKEGRQWMKATDNWEGKHKRLLIPNLQKKSDKVQHGSDIRMTINIDYQDILDRALRDKIQDDKKIAEALAILVETRTGAIRAMVNLKRVVDKKDTVLREIENFSVNKSEQGSVMKTVLLTALIDDGYVKSINQTVPCTGNYTYGKEVIKKDKHVYDYEREYHSDQLPVWYGLQTSSNTVFETLIAEYYGKDPKKYYDKLSYFKIMEPINDFDLNGLKNPYVRKYGDAGWTKPDLLRNSFGYAMETTPIHLIEFYNAIANGGWLMKPYLVEKLDKNGNVITPKPVTSIFSKNTADLVTECLKRVTDAQGGTATVLAKAPVKVAGKTGTARVALTEEDGRKPDDHYHTTDGRFKNQGSFIGFFPADAPEYTILVSVRSVLGHESSYGGVAPARTILDVINALYALGDKEGTEPEQKGSRPVASVPAAHQADGKVPSLKGLGLEDALFLIENCGYRCEYTGSGHVSKQTPEAGKALEKGETITITLS